MKFLAVGADRDLVLCARQADVVKGALELGPIFFLVRSQAQFGLDMRGPGVPFGGDVIGGQPAAVHLVPGGGVRAGTVRSVVLSRRRGHERGAGDQGGVDSNQCRRKSH
ncbi:MAG: hypothetical protein ABSG76_18260 [Xanthobacteraceae bacterium]|jgi:hypothetical protein